MTARIGILCPVLPAASGLVFKHIRVFQFLHDRQLRPLVFDGHIRNSLAVNKITNQGLAFFFAPIFSGAEGVLLPFLKEIKSSFDALISDKTSFYRFYHDVSLSKVTKTLTCPPVIRYYLHE